MSTDFPMPKTIGDPPATSPREYAPKRALEAVAEALITERSTLGQGGGSGYKSPIPADYKAPKHVDTIKDALKRLTHREMRQLVAEIFEAAKGDTIAKTDLPDILDGFAYSEPRST